MKDKAPALLPLLRSRAQAELLTTLLLDPERELSLTELAAHAGSSVATVQREVQRSEEAGLVRSRRVGNTRLVRADPDGALTEPLTEVLLRAFGPRHVLAALLSRVTGIEAAFVFGSWAARYAGERGRDPRDIDVLVLGAPDRDELDFALDEAERRLARPVNATVRTRKWWDVSDDAFRLELSTRPIVDLELPAREPCAP